jgi:prepilin-type N-terminal cleavage/methylation domain-containing protein
MNAQPSLINPEAFSIINLKGSGFTLVELIVAMAIASIVGLAVMMNYISQTRAYTIQRELSHMQQNLRAAMYMLQNDIRNTGRDPQRTGRYGIQAINRINNDADDAIGYAGLTMTRLVDTDNDGIANIGQSRPLPTRSLIKMGTADVN